MSDQPRTIEVQGVLLHLSHPDTTEPNWIGQGEYEFRLYAGKDRRTPLTSVKVVGRAK